MTKMKRERIYLGVDVGGTKILPCLVGETGVVYARKRFATPREGGADQAVSAIIDAMAGLLQEQKVSVEDLTAVGIAVPGVVDPDAGHVVMTPNMGLSDTPLVARLAERFPVPIALGNDCNLGTMGEKWLGAGRHASSVVGIFVGTGIGAGYARGDEIWRGHREAAMEIGHMVLQPGGPLCGCGYKGCFEAIASRTAIERQIRQAVKDGQKTALKDILGGDFTQIKSGALATALEKNDKLVTQVLSDSATSLGVACLNVRHLMDPEVIVVGGGVLESCGQFMLPIVREVVASDPLAGARAGGDVFMSALGDDAVVMGAVALARILAGRSPFDAHHEAKPHYAPVGPVEGEGLKIAGELCERSMYIRVNSKVKRLKKTGRLSGRKGDLDAGVLAKVCKGGPELLIVGLAEETKVGLGEAGQEWCRQRAIPAEVLGLAEAIEAYNASDKRRAAVFGL